LNETPPPSEAAAIGGLVDQSVNAVFARPAELSIVIPTFNEASNVELLVEAIDKAVPDTPWEVIFVDDHSPDGTADRVRELAQVDRRVRVVHRFGRRGLSSACVEGIMASSAPYCIVMDADFQHDEAIIPQMLARLKEDHTDLVVGSRYTEGGSLGDWTKSRIAISKAATWMANKLTGTPITDPMSGFFGIRRDAFLRSLPNLSSIGFKILLDIAASAPSPLAVKEVPYTFRTRQRGESKLDSLVLWEYLQLLIDKTFGKWIPTRFISFALVGGFGVFVHFFVLTSLYKGAGATFAIAQTAATMVAISSNFFLNNLLTYSDRRLKGTRLFWGWVSFNLVCATGAAANVGVADWMFERPVNWVLSALSGIAVSVVWNYAMSNIFTWRKK
jgi:dolichol-phosphate mannosyltransferase